jgi:hypothetical protein
MAGKWTNESQRLADEVRRNLMAKQAREAQEQRRRDADRRAVESARRIDEARRRERRGGS